MYLPTTTKKNPRTKKWVKAHHRIQDSHKNNCASIHQQDYFSDFPGSEDKETELWCLLMTALPLGKDLPTGWCSLTQKHKGKQTSEVRGGKGERDGKKKLAETYHLATNLKRRLILWVITETERKGRGGVWVDGNRFVLRKLALYFEMQTEREK